MPEYVEFRKTVTILRKPLDVHSETRESPDRRKLAIMWCGIGICIEEKTNIVIYNAMQISK